MLKRFFITGTDTSVGKTVVSRALLQALASGGKSVAGYKPVAKGSKETAEGMRNKDALVLQSVSSLELPYEAINPIALSEEESSVAHSCPINYTLLSNGLASLSDKVDHVVVEGTGGWRSLMNDLRPLSEWVVQEQLPTLKVQGVDLQRYADQLIARYRNPALRHRTWQIAMDGSQKLPQRMLDSVRWHLANHSDFDLLALGVAGWMRYVGGVDEQGKAIDISDPLLPVIQRAVANSEEGASRVKALLGMAEIFGNDLPQAARFTQKVQEAYDSLLTYGAKASVAKYAERLK